MESFLKKFSTIPEKFIRDFFVIAKEEYRNNEQIIDFEVVCEWLDTRKDHLKKILVDNFDENRDYVIEKGYNKTKTGLHHNIMITPDCFKELCMMSQVPKAKEVRRYFLEMENLIRRYYAQIRDTLYTDIGILKKNQKPKVNNKGGVLYIFKALNAESLYKIGKTNNLKRRTKEYSNGVVANDIEPEFVIPVKDIGTAERCLKGSIKNFQYRKYKEIYEIDIQVLKEAMEKCTDLANGLNTVFEQNKAKIGRKLKDMKSGGSRFFLLIVPHNKKRKSSRKRRKSNGKRTKLSSQTRRSSSRR